MIASFRDDSDLLKEISAKFDGNDKNFPKDQYQTFLNEIYRLVESIRVNIFSRSADSFLGFRIDLKINLSNLHQELFALKVLADCISDVGNESYLIFRYAHPNDSLADDHLSDIYRKIEKEKVSVLEKIKKEQLLERLLKLHDFAALERELDQIESLENKIDKVEEFLLDLEEDEEALVHLQSIRQQSRSLLKNLRKDLDVEKELRIKLALSDDLQRQIQERIIDEVEGNPSESSLPTKIILLHQLGVLDHLVKLPCMGGINTVAYFVSNILEANQGTVQSYINAILSPSSNSPDKSPYTKKASEAAKKILSKKSFGFKEIE